ncbi:hypothetical protein F4778DRAFT_61982 [Xylariomycetidae sp. FL2044]|nr:hypothetical protein F4778DRAFT_61982 [Xylariomycetidae sp. FL2044]
MTANLQPDLYASASIPLLAATSALVLRLVARRMTKQPLWFDDYFVIFSHLTGVAWIGIVFIWIQKGLGLTLDEIGGNPRTALYDSRFYLYLAELFYAFSLGFAKLSILCFYYRLFRLSSLKNAIFALMGATILWVLLRTFLAIFHCLPVAAFWDKSIPNAVCPIDDSTFFFWSVLAHAILDLIIMALPIFQIRNLKLKTSQKIGVSAMFAFGITVCIASIVVLVCSLRFDPQTQEMPFDIAPIIIWASVEVELAVVSACLPMLRPVFIRFAHRWLPNTTLGSSSDQYGSKKNQSAIRLQGLTGKKSKARGLSNESTDNLNEYNRIPDEAEPYQKGLRVVITGADLEQGHMPDETVQGIMVRSEMRVSVGMAQQSVARISSTI